MQIYYYGGKNPQNTALIQMILKTFPISVSLISQTQGNMTLDELIKGQTNNAELKLLPDIDVIIFHELSDDTISEIIEQLKQKQITIPYKCVVTKHNRLWKLIDLCKELIAEHEYFNSYEKLRQCIAEVSELQETDYTETSWKNYEAAFMSGYFYLQKQAAKNELDATIQVIITAKTQLCKKS